MNYREEHAFRRFHKEMKKGSIPSVILLCGKEQFLVEWARNQIIDANISPSSKVLDLTVLDEQDPLSWMSNIQSDRKASALDLIKESCETMPLLSNKKVVVVKESKFLAASEKQEGKNSDLAKLCDYLPNIPETTILIFTSLSVDRKKKLPKAIMKCGEIFDFTQLERNDFISFADKRFKDAGISVSGRIMHFLVDKTGYYNKESDYDLYTFSNDIKKMIAMSEEGVLTEEIVRDTVESDVETFVFNLMNSISENRKDRAFSLLHNIVSGKSDVSGIVALIVSQFEAMLSIKELTEARVSDRIIAERTGINEARIRILKPVIYKYSLDEIRKKLISAYAIDRNIKMGLLKPSLALEMFIAELM